MAYLDSTDRVVTWPTWIVLTEWSHGPEKSEKRSQATQQRSANVMKRTIARPESQMQHIFLHKCKFVDRMGLIIMFTSENRF